MTTTLRASFKSFQFALLALPVLLLAWKSCLFLFEASRLVHSHSREMRLTGSCHWCFYWLISVLQVFCVGFWGLRQGDSLHCGSIETNNVEARECCCCCRFFVGFAWRQWQQWQQEDETRGRVKVKFDASWRFGWYFTSIFVGIVQEVCRSSTRCWCCYRHLIVFRVMFSVPSLLPSGAFLFFYLLLLLQLNVKAELLSGGTSCLGTRRDAYRSWCTNNSSSGCKEHQPSQ